MNYQLSLLSFLPIDIGVNACDITISMNKLMVVEGIAQYGHACTFKVFLIH